MNSYPRPPLLLRALLLMVIAYTALLPLREVLAYPDRVAVLPNLQTDAEAYYTIAREVAATWTLDALPVRHPPGWIALLAAVFSFTGASLVAGKVLLWVAFVATIAGSAWLARRVWGPGAGWMAALLCASSRGLHGYVGTLQYEVFTGALLALAIVLGVRTIEAPEIKRWRWAVGAGLAGGVLIVTRETFAVIMPLVAVWIASGVYPRTTIRHALGIAAIVMALSLAPAAGWSMVQSVRHGTLVTISEKGPIVIELGNNPLANGTYNAPLVGIAQPSGWAFVRAHPDRWAVLAGRKVLYFWGVLRDGWNVPRPAAVWMWRASTGLVPFEVFAAVARGGWLLLLFGIALALLGGDGLRRWWILPAAVLTLMAVHIVTLSSYRFAVPTLPLVLVLTSGPLTAAAVRAGRALSSRTVLAAALLLTALVVAMQWQAWPLERTIAATSLDGLSADNVADPIWGEEVRRADAARGTRPVVLLADEYLPRGTVVVRVRVRGLEDTSGVSAPALSLALVDLAGTSHCSAEIPAALLSSDTFKEFAVTCPLPHDLIATLAVVTLARVDFVVADVRMRWLQ